MQDTDNIPGTRLQAQIDTNLKRVYGEPLGKALPDRLERLLGELRRVETARSTQSSDTGRSQGQGRAPSAGGRCCARDSQENAAGDRSTQM